VGLEFVVYARPDVVDLADPVRFALNVNGGRSRDDLLALGPDDGPGWWAVLDLPRRAWSVSRCTDRRRTW